MARCLFALLLLTLVSCQAPLPQPAQFGANRSPLFQRQGAARLRDPMPLIRQFHAPLIARNPELVQLKYQAMAADPFAFYRATAFLFYSDLKAETALSQAPRVPLQGDFHLENMGTYLSSDGRFGYDLNDFDEAVSGPAGWDLARLAVSIHLAADMTGFGFKDRQKLIGHFLGAYQAQLQKIQRQPALLQQLLDERYLDEKAAKQVVKAREFSRVAWLTEMVQGRGFALNDKVRPISPAERQAVAAALQAYAGSRREGTAFFALKDAASRIAGKGSLGRYRYLALIEGRSPAPVDDLILEIKEAIVPSASYAGVSRSRNEAERIVMAFRSALPGVDPLLGSTSLKTPAGVLPAYVRELLPKETVNLEKLNKTKEYEGMLNSTALIIARMHARNGQVQALLAQAPQLFPAIQTFADSYAERVALDWKAFNAAGK